MSFLQEWSRRPAWDPKFFHAVEQTGAAHTEARRGALWPADHPVGVPQCLQDVRPFDLFQRLPGGRGVRHGPTPLPFGRRQPQDGVGVRMTARSMTFCSSRTLPGQ